MQKYNKSENKDICNLKEMKGENTKHWKFKFQPCRLLKEMRE